MAKKESKGKSPERRAEIVDALYRCIAQQGYSGTSVRDIAAEANIKAPAIYYYFESKEHILYMLADHIFDSYRDQFRDFLQKGLNKPSGERLKLGSRYLFMKIAGDRDLIVVFQDLFNLSRYDKRLRTSLRKLYRRYRDEVAEFVAQCIQQSDLPEERAYDLAAFLVSASEGASGLWGLDPKGVSLSRMADMADRLIDSALSEWYSDISTSQPEEN
jgi:AcrR family transcriptional regulator